MNIMDDQMDPSNKSQDGNSEHRPADRMVKNKHPKRKDGENERGFDGT